MYMGVFACVQVYVCMYINVKYVSICMIWMILVCGCIYACTYKHLCVFDQNFYVIYVYVCICRYVNVSASLFQNNNFQLCVTINV